jgi:hypothetical protein
MGFIETSGEIHAGGRNSHRRRGFYLTGSETDYWASTNDRVIIV